MGKMENDLQRGSLGECIAWDILIKSPKTRSVVDVRDDKKFQQYDVDFLWENSNRQFVWIEVKTDYKAHETGNIVYEVSTSGNIGCFEKTCAKYIMYYVVGNATMYYVNCERLKTYVKEHPLKEYRMGDNAIGYLIPISDLLDTDVILHEWKGYEDGK